MIAIPKDDNLVLTVPNAHVADCGQPPQLTAGEGEYGYTGYFETEYGEQLTVQINREAKVGVLRMGDVGWDRHIVIEHDRIVDDIHLSALEFDWLALCWRAATDGELVKPLNLRLPEIIHGLKGQNTDERTE